MANIGIQTTFSCGFVSETEFKPIELAGIGDLSFSTPQVDATIYGGGKFRRYIAGIIEPQSFDITVNYVSHDETAGSLYKAFTEGKKVYGLITLYDGRKMHFVGFVTGYSETIPIDEKIQQTFTFQLSGFPTFEEGSVPEKVLVSFNSNGGTGVMQSVEVPTATPYAMVACAFTAPEGYTFQHWISDNGTVYNMGAQIDLKRDMEFTAVWLKNAP